MATVTCRTRVDIARDACVFRIRVALSVLVAINATERAQVAKNGMALRACYPPVSVMARVDPEPTGVVIHDVWCPDTRAMAGRTVMCKHLLNMVLAGRLLVIRSMTLIAV